MAGAFDDKQPVVDLAGLGHDLGEVLQAAAQVEVGWVVDDSLDPERAAVLEVLLDAAVLVAKVDAHVGAGAEDARAVGRLGGAAQRAGEDHRELFGAPDADIVGHQRLEEASGAARVVEDQRAAGFDLAD